MYKSAVFKYKTCEYIFICDMITFLHVKNRHFISIYDAITYLYIYIYIKRERERERAREHEYSF